MAGLAPTHNRQLLAIQSLIPLDFPAGTCACPSNRLRLHEAEEIGQFVQ